MNETIRPGNEKTTCTIVIKRGSFAQATGEVNFMKWQNYIHSEPSVLAGKPVIRGTRLSVEFLLSLLSEGWTESEIQENYPQLSREALRAIFAFAAECTRDELVFALDDGERIEAARE